MTTSSPYIQAQALAIRGRMDELLETVRGDIEASAGMPIKQGSVRVRQRELESVVVDACREALPENSAAMAKLIAREPSWLETETEDMASSRPVMDFIRSEMTEAVMSELKDDMRAAILSQYPGVTFTSFVEEIRAVMKAAGRVGSGEQSKLENACALQESKAVPNAYALLEPMHLLLDALKHIGKSRDRKMLVQARTLMELIGLMDTTHCDLSSIQTLQTSSPRP